MAGKTCQICGKASGIYPLCIEHLQMKQKGLVIKNTNTNKWELIQTINFEENIFFDEEENLNCLICNKETKSNHLFCSSCFSNKVRKTRYNFNHNRESKKIREQYFIIKEILESKVTTKEEWDNNIILMYALAEELDAIYYNDYLIERVTSDILNLKKQSKLIENQHSNFNDEDFRKKWPAEHQCDDGHYVRSYSEMLIDNWLYNNKYVHAYEKSVYMESAPEAIVLSDFYLPEGNVYIEFWGIDDDEKYLKRKEEKIRLYEENGYSRIDLNESHIKRLNDILPRELAKFISNKKRK